MARAIGSGVLSFGLVSIPVEIHSAIEDHSIRFHLLHKKCGSRVRNQMICPVCNVVVERADLVRGFEVSKDNYVRITEAELDSLEAGAHLSSKMGHVTDRSSVGSSRNCGRVQQLMSVTRHAGNEVVIARIAKQSRDWYLPSTVRAILIRSR